MRCRGVGDASASCSLPATASTCDTGQHFGFELSQRLRVVQQVPEQQGDGGGGGVGPRDDEAEGLGLDVDDVELLARRGVRVGVFVRGDEFGEEVAAGGVGVGEAVGYAVDCELAGGFSDWGLRGGGRGERGERGRGEEEKGALPGGASCGL